MASFSVRGLVPISAAIAGSEVAITVESMFSMNRAVATMSGIRRSLFMKNRCEKGGGGSWGCITPWSGRLLRNPANHLNPALQFPHLVLQKRPSPSGLSALWRDLRALAPLIRHGAMLSTGANPTDGRFDGDAKKGVAGGSFHPSGSSAAIGLLNGVGNGGCKRSSGYSRSLYVRRRAAEARAFGHPALGSRHPLPRHPRDPAQYPDHCLGDGHRHRGADGDRHGAGRRRRRHPSQLRCRGPGRAGAAGQEVRIGNGGQSADHRPRRDAVGCAGADERARVFRHSGRDRRRQGRAG